MDGGSPQTFSNMQFVKDYLVRQGPENFLVRASLSVHARLRGFRIQFEGGNIAVINGNRKMILNKAQYVQVPFMMEYYNLFFDTMCSEVVKDAVVLDFSQPGLHRYKKSGIAFYFPSVPEDDVMDAYTAAYQPKSGDIVWDCGAHAGATSYFLAKLVGPEGKVYAFEPDESNYAYLTRNIALHGLTNIIPVKKALAGKSGTANFIMDGSMSAGLSEWIHYVDQTRVKTVPTVSISDACAEFGEVPQYIKMDIEGAEVAAVESSLEFLKSHPIHFAIESNHPIDGVLSARTLEQLFPKASYEVWSSDKFSQLFTWAKPGAAKS